MNPSPKFSPLALCTILLGLGPGHAMGSPDIFVESGLTYISEFMDQGGSFYDGEGGLVAEATLVLADTGFVFNISHRQAARSAMSEMRRLDYTLAYETSVGEELPFQTVFAIAVMHHQFYNSSSLPDSQEVELAFSWDHLLPAGLTLSYAIASERMEDTGKAGFYHVIGISHSLSIPWFDQNEPLVFDIFLDGAYRDGVGGDSVHAWSHATLGIFHDIEISPGLFFSPAVLHQFSSDNSDNPEDVTYFELNLAYSF